MLVLLVSMALALAVLLSGIAIIAVSIEPNADYIEPDPWLFVLAPNRIGIEFITYGREFSAVQYGVVDSGGNWVVWPMSVTPRSGYSLYPSGASAVSDPGGRIHVAWSLFDSTGLQQSYRYLQLSDTGLVLAATGPVGNRSVSPSAFGTVSPVINVTSSTVDVAWTDQGTTWAATLDLTGHLIQPAHTLAGNVTGPTRVPAPLPSMFGSSASSGIDGTGSTFCVWEQARYVQTGRQSVLGYEVRFYRTGPGGEMDRIVYSTDDTWWTTKSMVLPGFVLALTGAVMVPILIFVLAAARRRRRCVEAP